MSDNSSAKTPHETVLAEIALVPLMGEEDDFQTITTLEEVRDDVLSAAAAFPDYVASISSRGTRDAGIILLVGELARQLLSQQALLIEMFKAGAAAISLLGKRDHIKRIEVTLAGDSFIIDEPDKVTAQRLLDTWEAQHPGKATSLTPSSVIQVTGVVSKA